MVSQRIRGKVVFVSSFLGYTTFAGYSSYSPGKYALRGLFDV
jgi:3-dehydrosphinganine reductase